MTDVIRCLEKQKQLAEKAFSQIQDKQFFETVDDDSNSIAIIMKHMAGNMRSRWTDFLTTDGEKPDRNRDSEFLIESDETKESILNRWQEGWQCTLDAIEALKPDDLNKTIQIHGENHSVIQATNRQLGHYSYHVGQIVFLAKHFTKEKWKTLSIARGKSEAFNQPVLKE